jgi:uncharacterized RDD family membrane protein YckC
MQPAATAHRHAGFVSRAIAFVVDALAISAIVLVAEALSQAIGAAFLLHRAPALLALSRAALVAATFAFGAIVPVAYPVVFWALCGQTPGKALLGLRVVRADGRRVTVATALLRYLGYWISAIPLFLGFAWILVDDERRGWHDLIAGTYVEYA